MDLNLHLLTPDQIKMIQDICLKNFWGLYGKFEGFRSVRDQVDLIILDDSTGYDMFDKYLNEEEEKIREIIDEERRRRQGEGEYGQNRPGDNECANERESWPRLPNYEDPDGLEPSIADWDEDRDALDMPEYSDYFNAESLDQWIQFRTSFDVKSDNRNYQWEQSRLRSRGRKCNPWKESDFIKIHERLLSDESELLYSTLTNFDLFALDERLGRIKWNRLRRNSGTMMGCYVEDRDDKDGRLLARKIFLFKSNIENAAAYYSVPVEYVMTETFVHEMFHAHFSPRSKDFISAYLSGVTDIDEPMTECAMLCFMKEYDKKIFSYAYSNVKSKLSSTNPHLKCYGFGACLYDYFSARRFFKGKPLQVYQKIQPCPRMSMRLVRAYLGEMRHRAFSESRCFRVLYEIMSGLNARVKTISTHFEFNGEPFGTSTAMVYSVLKYYADYSKADLAAMERDFDSRNLARYGARPLFEVESLVTMPDMNTYYDMSVKITLSCGTVIVPLKRWESGYGKNTNIFLRRVKFLQRMSKIDIAVRMLR